MKKVITLLSCLFSLTSFAQSSYLEGQIGMSNFAINSAIFNANVDKTAFAAGLRAGWLLPTKNEQLQFGFETGLEYAGNAKIANVEIAQSNVDLLAVGQYAVTDKVDLFAKAGVAVARTHFENNGLSANSKSKLAAKAALGAAVKATDTLSFTLSASHLFANEFNGSLQTPISVTNAMLGLRYTL